MDREQRQCKLSAEKEFPHKQFFSVLGLLHLMEHKFKEVKREPEKPKQWAVAQPSRECAAWSIFAELTDALSWLHPRPGRGKTTGSSGHSFLSAPKWPNAGVLGHPVLLDTLMARAEQDLTD